MCIHLNLCNVDTEAEYSRSHQPLFMMLCNAIKQSHYSEQNKVLELTNTPFLQRTVELSTNAADDLFRWSTPFSMNKGRAGK